MRWPASVHTARSSARQWLAMRLMVAASNSAGQEAGMAIFTGDGSDNAFTGAGNDADQASGFCETSGTFWKVGPKWVTAPYA